MMLVYWKRYPKKQDFPLVPAFKLVRNLLAEKPRTFQDLLTGGVAAEPGSASLPAADVASEASSSSAGVAGGQVREAGKGKGKARGRGSGVEKGTPSIVPEGHPFVSANFLKNRVLPVLASQNLIVKSVHRTPTSSVFKWSLITTATPDPSSPPSAVRSPRLPARFNPESHWDRLLSDTHPAPLAAELKDLQLADKAERREQAYEQGRERRSGKEIREWEGRRAGLTTEWERRHLNRRRAGGRPEKERRRLAAVDELEAFV